MTNAFWDSSSCSLCKKSTNYFCDGCKIPICDNHKKKFYVEKATSYDFCPHCMKKIKPNAKIGGLKITEKMIRTNESLQ